MLAVPMNPPTTLVAKGASRLVSLVRISGVLFFVLQPMTLSAQTSLADVARQEAARRKTVTQPSRVYTNADITPDTLSLPPSAVSPSQTTGGPTLDATQSTAATAQADAPDTHNADYCEACDRDLEGRIARSDAARRQFMRATGFPEGRPGWTIDHRIPLACGGSDDAVNMQWQTDVEAKAKDRTERLDCRRRQVAPPPPQTTILGVPVPVTSVPIVLPPSCGTNTPREQAMSGYTQAAGFGGPSQPLPPCAPARPIP